MGVPRSARVIATIQATVSSVFFVVLGGVRADNPFLVPDAVLVVLLLVSAYLPGRWAAPSLIFSFALAVGVWSVSLAQYVVRGEFLEGANHVPLIVSAVVQSMFLVRRLSRPRAEDPGGRQPVQQPVAA